MGVNEQAGSMLALALSKGDTRQLRLALADVPMETAEEVAAALDKAAARIAVELLIQILAEDESGLDEDSAEHAVTARIHAALMLGHMRDPRAVEPLLQVLATAELTEQWYVVDALGMIADPRAIEPLIEALGHPDIDMCKAAWHALAAIGEPAVIPLIRAMRTSDVHYLAPWALGTIGDPRAVAPLIEVLQNRQRVEQIRYGAAVALGQLGYAPSFDLFIQQLHDSTESTLMHSAAVLGLGYLGDRRAIESLIALTATDLRRAAVEALGLIGDARAIDCLIVLLQTDPSIRDSVAKALGAIGDPHALSFLKQQQQDVEANNEHAWIRAAIDRAIERIEQHKID